MNFYYPSWSGSTFLGSWNTTEYKILDIIETNHSQIFIKIYDKNQNIKYLQYWNSETQWLEKIEWEINQNGFGVCEVYFTDKIDINIECEDILEIYFSEKIVYKGFAAADLEFYSKKITFFPAVKKLQDFIVNAVFTNKTISFILQTIITQFTNKTGIKWDNKFIDTGSVDPFSFEFTNETIFDIVEKLVNLLQDRYYFIDENNYLNIRKIETNKINKYFMLNTYNKNYSDIKIKFDYTNIEATQYKVYKKNASGSTVFVGRVGDEGNVNYPPLLITNKVRPIESAFEVTEVCNDTTALQLAYATLKQKAKIKQNIAINNVNLNFYTPKIDDYLYLEYYTSLKKITFDNIVRADSDITQIDKNTYHLEVNGADEKTIVLPMEYENIFLSVYNRNHTYYLTFRFFNQNDERVFEIDDVMYDFEIAVKNVKKIYILKYGLPNYFSFDFKLYGFKDYIKNIVDNVTKIKYTLQNNGITCDFECGSQLEAEGDELYRLKKKIRALETINAI